MTNEKPYDDIPIHQLMIKVASGKRPEFKQEIPKSYRDLIESCWSQEPHRRPSFQQIVDLLKNNKEFITENVNEDVFFDYINYIDNFKTNFNSTDNKLVEEFYNIEILNQKVPVFKLDLINEYCSYFNHFDYNEFLQFDEETKNLIKKSQNDPDILFIVSRSLIKGLNNFPINIELGIKYLKQCIQKGHFNSIVYYCKMLIKGKIIPKDTKIAFDIIEEIMPKDQEQESKNLLYGLCFNSIGIINDAFHYFVRAKNLGNAEANYEIAKTIMVQFSDSEEDLSNLNYDEEEEINENDKYSKYKKALKSATSYLQKAIELGYSKAMYLYGRMLIKGNLYKKNETKGYEYIKKAADNGHKTSLFIYALYLSNIYNVENPFDNEEILDYIRKASELGHPEAMEKYSRYLYNTNDPQLQKKSIGLLKNHVIKDIYIQCLNMVFF